MPNVCTWTSRVWAEFHARNLTRTDRDALLTLATYRDRGGLAWPAHATLAARARCSIRSVQRALQQGRHLGLVVWVHRRIRRAWRSLRTSNAYRFTKPEKPVTAGLRPKSAHVCTNGQGDRGGENQGSQAAYNEVLKLAAGLPDLLAARREAFERMLAAKTVGQTISTVTRS